MKDVKEVVKKFIDPGVGEYSLLTLEYKEDLGSDKAKAGFIGTVVNLDNPIKGDGVPYQHALLKFWLTTPGALEATKRNLLHIATKVMKRTDYETKVVKACDGDYAKFAELYTKFVGNGEKIRFKFPGKDVITKKGIRPIIDLGFPPFAEQISAKGDGEIVPRNKSQFTWNPKSDIAPYVPSKVNSDSAQELSEEDIDTDW